jgi:hypothetical protein
MLKDCNKGLRYWSPRPTWMKPLYVTGLHWFKRGYFKDWYAYNIISNYDKTIYNVRTRNTHQLIQDLKEYLANTVYMPLVSTFIISIKM